MSEVVQLKTRQTRAWEAYVAARDRAEQTRDITDGIAAGRAWAVFIAEFLPPEQRSLITVKEADRAARR
ncbi:hypothetical protein [Chelatococcus reniformis]|uniref:Uncharacterized protein n=1 Tax=Chelatococcus reniformis TaxID=1494448 RepID=A0A916XHE4_9HYPH|nr:hypothetical protein [Chelatococcus reniformis]GGC70600.1 hypothetical protein GCM10010994_31440 [Chelatococcus reniformis]